jgi:hypothetical protein
MSAETIAISSHHGFTPRKTRRSRKRVFDLGRHWYSGAPGLSWTTNYWVKRITPDTWELFGSEEGSLTKRQSAGLYSVEQLRDYFDDVAFWMDEEYWIEIGLGRRADVIGLDGTHLEQEE